MVHDTVRYTKLGSDSRDEAESHSAHHEDSDEDDEEEEEEEVTVYLRQ